MKLFYDDEFNDIYMPELAQAPDNSARPATENVVTQGA
jgi:hypothetical protein